MAPLTGDTSDRSACWACTPRGFDLHRGLRGRDRQVGVVAGSRWSGLGTINVES
ncbi:hypothetical protein ACU4GD_21100 [Cupriavidus basilensis]